MDELVAKINLLEKNALWESSVAPDDRDSWRSRLTVSTPRNHFEFPCCNSEEYPDLLKHHYIALSLL